MFQLTIRMTKRCLLPALACLVGSTLNALSIENVWINEIHYDNTGGDVGEFVEVAGIDGTNLAPLTLEFYNGNNGTRYKTEALSGALVNDGGGYGFAQFLVSGIQNGAPDGVALVLGGGVLQFISYEGTFVASNGSADGLASRDIGVSEQPAPAVGLSLQFLGYGDTGSWTGPTTSTAGALNTGQALPTIAPDPEPPFNYVPDNSATFGLLGLALATLGVCGRRNAP